MKRLDQVLVDLKMASSRSQAQEKIKNGYIEVELNEKNQKSVITKPAFAFDEQVMKVFEKHNPLQKYVSRAGLKLEAALKRVQIQLKGIDVLDIGLSTGGFADCLLQAQVGKVFGVDVGQGQLSPKLATESRLVSHEKVNARYSVELSQVLNLQKFELIVMDVSFISISLIFPNLKVFLKPGGCILSLVKPQFELDADKLNKKGLVKEASLYVLVESKIKKLAIDLGFEVLDYFPSEIQGADGNNEFFIFCRSQIVSGP